MKLSVKEKCGKVKAEEKGRVVALGNNGIKSLP